MSKTSISGDRGDDWQKDINPTEPLIPRVHILQTDNDSWSKALQVTLTFVRSERAQEKAPVIVLNKPELDLDTRKLDNLGTGEHARHVKPAIQRTPWRAIYGRPAPGGPGKHKTRKCSKQRPWRGRRILNIYKFLSRAQTHRGTEHRGRS